MNRRRIDRDEQVARAGAFARRFAGGLARAVGALAVAALVVYGLVAGLAWLRTSERFGVQSVVFTGVSHSDEGDLLRRAGVTKGMNIFGVDLAQAARAMEEDPWVAHVRIARELPATLRIAVDERRAVALVSMNGLYAADAQGLLFKRVLAADGLDLPVVTGLSREAFAGERREDVQLKTALALVEAYAAHPVAQRAPLAEVHVGSEGGETVYSAWIGDEPVEVTLGPVDAAAKDAAGRLDRLARVWDELERRGARAKAIDLGNRLRPDWVAARLE